MSRLPRKARAGGYGPSPLLAENDLRALLNHSGCPHPGVAEGEPPLRPLAAHRARHRRLFLPRPAQAQASVTDSTPRLNGPVPAAFSSISDVTIARDEEFFARRDVNQYTVEIHKKVTLSIACISFVLIGIALALRFPGAASGWSSEPVW